MLDSVIIWTGDNQIAISNFLGHENFWHKGGQLIIHQDKDCLVLEKGEKLAIDVSGALYLPNYNSNTIFAKGITSKP
tara:strand:- start:480 stop:710 length:231 start_codon:yes stop_codon:yes gene_type:complete